MASGFSSSASNGSLGTNQAQAFSSSPISLGLALSNRDSQSIGTPRHLGDAAYAIFRYDSVPGSDRVSEDHAPSERGSLDVALRRRSGATLVSVLRLELRWSMATESAYLLASTLRKLCFKSEAL